MPAVVSEAAMSITVPLTGAAKVGECGIGGE
jgi:hypothetical protein